MKNRHRSREKAVSLTNNLQSLHVNANLFPVLLSLLIPYKIKRFVHFHQSSLDGEVVTVSIFLHWCCRISGCAVYNQRNLVEVPAGLHRIQVQLDPYARSLLTPSVRHFEFNALPNYETFFEVERNVGQSLSGISDVQAEKRDSEALVKHLQCHQLNRGARHADHQRWTHVVLLGAFGDGLSVPTDRRRSFCVGGRQHERYCPTLHRESKLRWILFGQSLVCLQTSDRSSHHG